MGSSGCRAFGISELVLAHWWVELSSDMAGYGVWGVLKLVLVHWSQGRSQGRWLRDPWYPRAGVGLLVGRVSV